MTDAERSAEGGDMIFVRQARLKMSFAHLYPPVDPEVWMPAAELGAKVLFWRLTHEGLQGVELRRPLDDAHFEFRGGWTRGETMPLRTRANDYDPSAPRTRRGAGR